MAQTDPREPAVHRTAAHRGPVQADAVHQLRLDVGQLEALLDDAATGWMVKPFDPKRLLEIVRKVIG